MKIGYYIQHFPYKDRLNEPQYYKQYAYGGAEVVAYHLAVNMAKRGHEVSIFTTSIDRKNSIEKKENMVIYRYAKNFKVGRSNLSFGLFYKPAKYQLDVIHAHLSVKIDGLAALLHAKREKIPLIVTHHADTNVYSGFIHKTRIVYLFSSYVIKKSFSYADIIISPSKYYIDESRFLGKHRDKTVVIPNGINVDEFDISYSREECKEKLSLLLDDKIVLFLSALSSQKGPDVLLKAMPKILKKVPNAKLVFVGGGKMRNDLEALSKRRDIEKHVKFVGFVEESLKPLYYKAADVFCLPSTTSHESFGIVNLEAMACSVPIVASKIGGVPDVVKDGENGLLVPPKDSEVLADAIIYLLENEDVRERMGKSGREKVKDYSWERIAEETEKVYKEVLA
jgi:glycosyltransferase involved in cell wall biosynthesis